MTLRSLGFGLLWLGFVLYAFLLAPPDQPDTAALIGRLATGDWQGINPAIIAIFNAMGLWPVAYAWVMLGDGHGQKLWAWPFVVGSFAIGAFALLPYLALRQPLSQPPVEVPRRLAVVSARWPGWGLAVAAALTLSYGLLAGDWADFAQQWQTSRFIHVMTLDFTLLWGLFPALVGADLARRGQAAGPWLGLLAVPLVGASVYVALRSPLQAQITPAEAVAPIP